VKRLLRSIYPGIAIPGLQETQNMENYLFGPCCLVLGICLVFGACHLELICCLELGPCLNFGACHLELISCLELPGLECPACALLPGFAS
jgi:hypothetical protein